MVGRPERGGGGGFGESWLGRWSSTPSPVGAVYFLLFGFIDKSMRCRCTEPTPHQGHHSHPLRRHRLLHRLLPGLPQRLMHELVRSVAHT